MREVGHSAAAVSPFEEGRRRVADMELGSWDEAFGRPWPKGRHLSQLRRRKRLKAMIHNEVSGSKTIPRSEAGFAQIGARHESGTAQARPSRQKQNLARRR